MSQWVEVLNIDQIEERYASTAALDPAFAAKDRVFWETRTPTELSGLRAGAWEANDPETYQMARSYLALRKG